jgi:hypothetical protein
MSRYGKVGILEMQALIATATLMNYVPLRPGLFGRVAYQKLYHDIAWTDSAKAVIHAMIVGAAIACYFMAATLAHWRFGADLLLLALAPIPTLASIAMLRPRTAVWLWAAVIRYAEFLAIAVRYWAAFALIGAPIEARGALAFACISVIASMIPLAGNGLGLREWAVGLLAPLLTSYQMELGITADLINRAGEMLVAIAVGAAGAAWLMRVRFRRTSPPTRSDS